MIVDMARFAKIVAVLILIAVSASSLAAQSLLSHAQSLKLPAGCHEHGSKAPSPHPTNYECCVIGHNTAVPQAAHSAILILSRSQIELVGESSMCLSGIGHSQRLAVSSGSPPGANPLRI
jgi:hypothetical protein